MLASHLVSHLVLTVIQVLFGIFVNGIIVIVNSTDLIKQRKLIPLDLLVSCLAISRMGIQLASFYINLALLSLIKFPQFTEKLVVFTFMNDLGLWFATWLHYHWASGAWQRGRAIEGKHWGRRGDWFPAGCRQHSRGT